MRGTRKQDTPPAACASIRNASDIGADMNHLWPVNPVEAIAGALSARRIGAHIGAALLLGHAHAERQARFFDRRLFDWSYLRVVTRGAHSRNSLGFAISAASEALVMVIGHRCPHSSCGGQVEARRPGLVALARSASPFSQIDECSPLAPIAASARDRRDGTRR
jgi:hypothetical protein